MHQITPTRGTTHLTFIGSGTMACAILDGLAKSTLTATRPGQTAKYTVSITARRPERVEQLSERYPGAYVTVNNADDKLWRFTKEDQPAAHIVLVCTKPQMTAEVCEIIRLVHEKMAAPVTLPTVVTMCPGITIPQLEGWLSLQSHSKRFPVVRTMPNTPVSVRQGATALVASQHATAAQVDTVIALFHVFSPCVEILPEESLLDVAAAVSGSGPAYIFQFHKFLVAAAVQWGLPENLARSLVMQTGVGASTLATDQPEVSLSSMISNVCVPGGSTEKGIKILEDVGLQAAVTNAVSTSLKANRRMRGDE